MGSYVLSVIAAALISGIVLSFLPEGPARQILRLLCGVFLAATALMPLSRISCPDLSGMVSDYYSDGLKEAQAGAQMARKETHERIKAETEAYIRNKAGQLGADIRPEVQLGEDGQPVGVQIDGTADKSQKQVLENWIKQTLGITKEKQIWTGWS